MDALILAAGLGTRLRPITESVPKALIEVGDTPMLEIVARRLIAAGVDRLIVNVHHHADQVIRFIDDRRSFGVETLISDERDELLETGGAVRKAASLFRRDAPFFIHNVDVISDIDLHGMYGAHNGASPLVTLAVMQRNSQRYLLFDDNAELCGYGNEGTGFHHVARPPVGAQTRLGFAGVHVVSPELLDDITETGAFSIISLYVRLASEGYRLRAYRVDAADWIDVGRPEHLSIAREAGKERAGD